MEPSPTTEPADELPFAGRLVAYVFLAIGLAGLFKLVASLFYDGLTVNLIDFACLYVGWGLLQGRSNAPGCASNLVGCLGIGVCLALIAALVISLAAWSQGERLEMHVHPSPFYVVTCMALLVAFAFWSQGVLKRPEVREYCDGKPKRPVLRRFRLEHLLALMAMVAYAAVGISPTSDAEGPKSYRRAVSSVAQDGATLTGTLHEVVGSGESKTLLHVVVVIDTVPKRAASSLEVRPNVVLLKAQGHVLLLNPNYRVHLYRDGVLSEGVESLTREQWQAYEASRQRKWTLEEIESFLKRREAKHNESK